MHNPLTERRIISLLILVLSSGLIASTFGLDFAELGGAFSPMFFPRIILFILTALAVLNVIIDMRTNTAEKSIELKPALIISIAFVAYVLLVVPLGYFISSVLMGLIVLSALGLRSPAMLFAIPVLSAGTLVALFNHVLKMPLPSSPFVWWL
ncbi:MAG: tripartite tricarboxylate transporter TctB family protein [Pseudomonadales bacterium]